jgi:hypothetical protein
LLLPAESLVELPAATETETENKTKTETETKTKGRVLCCLPKDFMWNCRHTL